MKNKKLCVHCDKYNLNTSKCMLDNKARSPDDICNKTSKIPDKS